MAPRQQQLNAHKRKDWWLNTIEIKTRVVEHPIIDARPHLGMSLALLVTHTSDLLNPVLMFILFQAVNQCKSEILADCLICNIPSMNFRQNLIDFRLGLSMFSHYLLGLFLLEYSLSQLLQLIVIQHRFQ